MLLEIYNENNKRQEKPIKPNINKIVLGILAFFSITFGCLNLLILEDINVFTIILILFTLIIYILNEYYKTNSITNYVVSGKVQYLVLSIICVSISLTSVYGVYQVVDKYSVKKVVVSYKSQIDSLTNKINSNYIDSLVRLNNQELYSKKMSDSVKQQISLKKLKLEQDLYDRINELKAKELSDNKNAEKERLEKEKIKSVVMIFLSFIVVIVECVIVFVSYSNGLSIKNYNLALEEYNRKNKELLNSKIGKQFQDCVESVKYIYSLYQVGDTFVRSKFNYAKNKTEFIDLLEHLHIISDDRSSKILVTEQEALELLDKHFTKII